MFKSQLSEELSKIIDSGLEKEFKDWVATIIDREVSNAFDTRYEFNLEAGDVLHDSIKRVLGTYVMEMDMKISSKGALIAMLDERIVEILQSGHCNIPLASIEQAVAKYLEKVKAEFQKNLFGPSETTIVLSKAGKSVGQAPVVINSVTFPIAHCQLAGIVQRIAANVPVWYYGAPGSGKTHIAAQVAASLNTPFYPVYLGPTTTESKLLGYKNAGQGTYVEGLLYEPYMRGGLIYLDEIDVTDPGVLVAINALISNEEYRFPDGKMVKRHEDVRFLAGANTIGLGSLQGFRRNSQDAAARDRWVKVKSIYDEAMERRIAISNCPEYGEKWARYVQKVRVFVATESTSPIHVTPRASYNGANMLQAGIPPKEVCDDTIFAEMSEDLMTAVKGKAGTFKYS